MSPHAKLTHQDYDEVTRDEYLEMWAQIVAKRQPNMNIEVVESMVDEGQRKVMSRYRIRGFRDGLAREGMSMLVFDEEGLLVRGFDEKMLAKRKGD